MECFVIFVMAWCWLNATESKPQNVSGYLKKKNRSKEDEYTQNSKSIFNID